ncbi:MAG: polyisoprenoid-binding protein [Chloroflexi bacterium]|nr:polyisoprenoid-binding protein [Chloroflexota bacterium]
MMVLETQPTTVATWTIDPAHTQVEFAVRHMMVTTVRGRFATFSGSVRADEADPARSSVEVTIDASSIDTREAQRDGHLRSPDFLDAEQFPTLAFRSRRVEALGGDRYRVVGDLTIRDITREAVLDTTFEGRAKDPWGGERAGFSARTSFDRRNYGLTWNIPLEAGGIVVGNEVKISLEVELVRQS